MLKRFLSKSNDGKPGGKFATLAKQIALVGDELGFMGAYHAPGGMVVNKACGQIVYQGRAVADVNTYLFIPGEWQAEFASAVARAMRARETRVSLAARSADIHQWLVDRISRGKD